ncbi:MAG: T9SS type A sorting domain-containing protein [Chitinophagales bacterium]
MKQHYLKQFVAVLLFTVYAGGLNAGHNFYRNFNSDYYVGLSWDQLFSNYCDCSGTTYVYAMPNAYADPNGSTWLWGYGFAHDGPTSGSYNWVVGPDYYNTGYVSTYYGGKESTHGCTCTYAAGTCPYNCSRRIDIGSGAILFATSHIKGPVNITASQGTSTNQIALTWDAGTDIPDGSVGYRIYRDGVLYATIGGANRSFTDIVGVAETHNYDIRTYTNGWGGSESYYNGYVTGYTFDTHFSATDGTLYGKTKLTWDNFSALSPDGIEVLRDGVQIAVVGKNNTQYTDFDGVPGVVYTYSIRGINGNSYTLPYYNTGYARPNGVIKGNVRTIFNGGVSGVTITATSTIKGIPYAYTATSDASGFYEIRDVFYDTAATYTIVPSKNIHKFNPDTLRRNLSMNANLASQVDFTDTTVFSVLGKVAFAADAHSASGCGIAGVDIYKNGQYTGVKTDANGSYILTIQDEGNYVIEPRYKNHTFDTASKSVYVNDNMFNVNFTDTKYDTLFVSIKGGCRNEVAHHANLNIASANGCWVYPSYYLSGALSQQFLVVPAQSYTVNCPQGNVFSDAVNPDPNIFFNAITVDLSERDSVQQTVYDSVTVTIPADTITAVNGTLIITPAHSSTRVDTIQQTIALQGRADFVHHGTLEVRVLRLDSSGCAQYPFVLEQESRYPTRVEISEFYDYGGVDIRCPVDSGELLIYDDVSDLGVQSVNFYNGVYNYTVRPGIPNIANPYTKVLQFFVNVGNAHANVPLQVLVTGHRPKTQTFVTKTPELPFFVLHDPPGDGSYAYMMKDSNYSYTYNNQYQYGGAAGIYTDCNIGGGVPIPFTGITIGTGVHIEAEVTTGRDNTNRNGLTTSFHATDQFSTSASPDFIGSDGDVFVGGSFNMIYALTDVIKFNNCAVEKDTQLVWGANGLATTYIYTEKHIRETLIPQLELLKSLSHGDTIDQIDGYIKVWKQTLHNNRRNRDTAATFIENISYSGGSSFDRSATNSTDTNTYVDYNIYLDASLQAGVVFGDISGWALNQFGIKANFRWVTNRTDETTISNSKTMGYHLEDGTPGDFFSVDIKKDKVNGTPSFKLVAGTSSCPHEAGTQARDYPEITLDNYVVAGVPLNTPANFVAHLYNVSESLEGRTYEARVVPESNLDGAIIKLAGQPINNAAASFTIPAGQQIPAVLSVERGPLASDYNNLQVQIYSPCDPDQEFTTNKNIVTFSAHFQSSCSPIDMFTPSDGWLVNADNHDSLLIIFSGYDASNPNLLEIGLEYRKIGQSAWLSATNPPIAKAALTAPYKNFWFRTNSLPDGQYELRAFSNCGAVPGGRTYSPILRGTIDRKTIKLYGTPSPADGILNINENISVTFNEAVDCNQFYNAIFSKLVRADNGQPIPHTITCSGNSILIETNPPSLLDSLQQVMLTATIGNVRDVNGNLLPNNVVWSFLVNRGQIFWDPSNKNISVTQGTASAGNATLRNVSASTADFYLVSKPDWMTINNIPNLANPTSVPGSNGTFDVNFSISTTLNPGGYDDTLIATINGLPQYLMVHVDVTKPAPNWTVDPSKYQYSMNVVTNFSLTDMNAPLSSDTRDKVAAFVKGECRGVGNIQYVTSLGKYIAFLTVYSDSVVGDTLSFRMWDALPGTEHQAKETLRFVNDGIVGQPLAPFILHSGGVYQTMTLKAGWNWFSLNVRSSNMTVGAVLKQLKPSNGDVVKTLGAYAQYSTASNAWVGALSQFSIANSYMMYLTNPDTLHFLGQLVKDTITKSVVAGWNWTGFPRQDNTSLSDYLKSYPASNGDIFKSQTAFSTFTGGSWNGTLAGLQPGEGYKLKAANSSVFDITPDRSLPSWQLNENAYEYNMTITAVLKFNHVPSRESHFLIGVFNGSACVGLAQPEYLTALDAYRIFATVHGDASSNNQPLSFKVWDLDNNMEYLPTYDPQNFVTDANVATVESPYVLDVAVNGINQLVAEGYSLSQNIPNPFSTNTRIEFSIPKEQLVTIEIFDQSGKIVATPVNGKLSSGRHQLDFAVEDLPKGIYSYRMTSGEFSRTKRMVIL